MLNCVESLKTNLPTTHHAKTPFTGRHPINARQLLRQPSTFDKTIGSITG